jgi:two-component system, cell cycle sensor histidine kinase and response regulator CckA
VTAVSNDLRQRAEQLASRLSTDPVLASALSPQEARLLHDLQVHQIELEIQNEELRRAEAALEASRARYFDLYDLAPVGYVTIGAGDRVLEANLTAAGLLGLTRSTLVGAPFTRFVEFDDRDAYYLHRRRLFTTRLPQVVVLRMRGDDHVTRWMRLEAATVPAADGMLDTCRMVLSDITAEHQLEEARARFEREMQHAQKAESLSRMAGAVAHHFNNHLAVVVANLELAMEMPAMAAPCLHDAMLAANKAAGVSGLLLTYLGQSSGSHAPVDLSRVLELGLELVRAAMPGHVTLLADLPVPGCAVNGNADQLRLLLANLATNAWEAAGDLPATVHMRVREVAAADIPAAGRVPLRWTPRDQPYACIEVRDTGCGIDADEIGQIFEPFFTHKFTGRGLGLPVVLGILHAHSGGLVVESRRGQESGSVFRAYLPVSSEPVAPVRASAGVSSEPAATFAGTVLIVEDAEPLRAVLRRRLEHLGISVLDAGNGIEAMEVFRRHQSDIRLVLCDLTMPHMNGWETLAALRRLAPALPFVLMSGYDETHVMDQSDGRRADGFLAKPYEVERLRQVLAAALGPRRP